MNSKDWILNACQLSTTSSILFIDKETQTSKIYVINSVESTVSPSRPLPKNIEATAKDDNVKTFEFCEVIQDPDDPDSVSIIKETFTEEVLTDSNSFFDTPTKNKYKYCKEVTQPYSKSYPNNCPIPNCKPKSDACKNLSDRPNQEVCLDDKMDCDKCKKTFVNPNNSSNNCERREGENKSSSCSSIGNIKDKKPPCEKSPICKSIDECSLKSCISSCVKESLKIAKKGSATCLEKFEKVIGVKKPKECDDKPTYYVLEKPKSQTNSSTTDVTKKNSIQSIFESQSQTVATITCAIKGFMGTVYNKTKDAVNMIRTESCRHLGIGEESGSSSKENKSEQKTKECNSIVSESKISLYDRIRGQTSEMEDSNESYNLEKVLEPAKEVIKQVASVVASTVSVLRNTSFDKIADDILDAKLNKSSPYDNRDNDKNPKKIAQDHEPGANASVFTMIKAKLLSMFSESQQETCDDSDDSDDDDDNNAEKLFDKYCEQ